jgi:hypothetical protein
VRSAAAADRRLTEVRAREIHLVRGSYCGGMLTAEALLAGPRGRRVCWELLRIGWQDSFRGPGGWPEFWRAAGPVTCLVTSASCPLW